MRNTQRRWGYGNRGRFKITFKVGFNVVSYFFWAHGFLCFLIDGHPQATAVLIPCSLLQGFKEAVMRITLIHSFHLVLFLALRCITRGGSIAYTRLSQRRRCLVQLEGEMSCTVGDWDVLNSRRRRCLVWPEMTVESGTSWWHSAVLVRSYIYWPCGPLR